jgi:aquaporin Z
MIEALSKHWPEYLIEAWCLGAFMISACFFGVALFHPVSPFSSIDSNLRNIAMGIAMGSTAVAIICSSWGKRSGAHFNPAVTLTFLRLRKIKPADAVFYIIFQFFGGLTGVVVSRFVLGDLLDDKAVNFVVTVPGEYGVATALLAELAISFLMMTMILFTANSSRLMRFTPAFAGLFVALFIAIESPISGMSMNPARSFASAAVAGKWTSIWIYFLAPPLAMLASSEFFIRVRGLKAVLCGKLNHAGRVRCIFDCKNAMES